MSDSAQNLNNTNLKYAVNILPFLSKQIVYVIDAINSDLAVGNLIEEDTKIKIKIVLDKLNQLKNQTLGYFTYSDSTNIITIKFAIVILKNTTSVMTLCTVNLSDLLQIFEELYDSNLTEYPASSIANIYDYIETLQTVNENICKCSQKINNIVTIEKDDDNVKSLYAIQGECGEPAVKCINYVDIRNPSSTNSIFIGNRDDINLFTKPKDIKSNILVEQVQTSDYVNISSINGNLLEVIQDGYIYEIKNYLFCLNCSDDLSLIKQIVIRNVLKCPSYYNIYIWNNVKLVWDFFITCFNINEVKEKNYKIDKIDFTKYFDSSNFIYFMYYAIGGNPTNLQFNVDIEGSVATKQVTCINTTCATDNLVGGEYFIIYDTSGNEYYVWMDTGSSAIDPTMSGINSIPVDISGLVLPDDNGVAIAIENSLNSEPNFEIKRENNKIIITNVLEGDVENAQDNNTGFLIETIVEGKDDVYKQISIDTTNRANLLNGGEYFIINSAENIFTYYFWINIDNLITDPYNTTLNGYTSVPIDLTTPFNDNDLAIAIETAFSGISDFSTSLSGNILTIEYTSYGDSNDIIDCIENISFDYFDMCLYKNNDFIGSSGSIGRNWLFSSPSNLSGDSIQNEGLVMELPQNINVLLCKFRRDDEINCFGGDTINSIKLLMYSNSEFNMGIIVKQCSLDVNTSSIINTIYPQTGNGTIINIKNTLNDCSQCIDYNFSEPLKITEKVVEIYLINFDVNIVDIGIYQIIIS